MPGADNQFKAQGWWRHVAILHPGQYGYQENRDGNPFLGLVVLFPDKKEEQSGQFHIDFRSWFSHYCPDNGNIAANYKTYVRWYASIPGYTPTFQLVFPELTRDLSQPTSSQSHDATGSQNACGSDIEESVHNFLLAWYVEHNFDRLLGFVAKDNVYNEANFKSLGVKSAASLWSRLFSDAFEKSEARISKLEGALLYRTPVFDDSSVKLKYVNARIIDAGTASYAIIDPDSLPSGALFPSLDAVDQRRVKWDVQAQFLDHLRKAYAKKMYVVVYAVIAAGLVRETAVQYWIKEDNCWKISAFQGTNW